jgi:hypothetical protein
MNEALSWMMLADIALNIAYQIQTEKNESKTGWHYDAVKDTNVITDVDKAATSFSVGSSIVFQYSDGKTGVYTLGEDGKWRDSEGHYLYMEDGKIYSTKDMA